MILEFLRDRAAKAPLKLRERAQVIAAQDEADVPGAEAFKGVPEDLDRAERVFARVARAGGEGVAGAERRIRKAERAPAGLAPRRGRGRKRIEIGEVGRKVHVGSAGRYVPRHRVANKPRGHEDRIAGPHGTQP